jgi:hypothetical protein
MLFTVTSTSGFYSSPLVFLDLRFRKEENLKENLIPPPSLPLGSEILPKKSINEENSSLFMNSILKNAKTEGRDLKHEKSQDYAQKSQQNCTSMNLASLQRGDASLHSAYTRNQYIFSQRLWN